MADSYSLYEAKARLSAIIRRVREGRSAIITLHGKPVAEIRALSPGHEDLPSRVQQLEERGIITGPNAGARVRPVVKRAGALDRFQKDREG
jgi:antitoxin (DNA-binding transcriptional repressor) of toxin-antitoxin stability system